MASARGILGIPSGNVVHRPRPLAISLLAIVAAVAFESRSAQLSKVVLISWWNFTSIVGDVRDDELWRVGAVASAIGIAIKPRHRVVVTAPAADSQCHFISERVLHVGEIISARLIGCHRNGIIALSQFNLEVSVQFERDLNGEWLRCVDSVSRIRAVCGCVYVQCFLEA